MKRVAELAWVTKNTELEVLVKSQAQKIAELKAACAELKRKKENVTVGYQRLSEKHKTLAEKVDWEKIVLAEAHAVELAKVREELYQET
jgi:ABC-type Fe3+-hydroxamate transport system substrate-binding protein